MKIKLFEFSKRKDKITFDFTEDITHLVDELNQVIEIFPVRAKGEANKLADIYTVKGNVSTNLTLKCSRCLTNYDHELEAEFDEVFIPNDIETDWDMEKENVHVLFGDEIDLSPIIEETVILSIPYIPVCDKECKGLCPSCGTNLNKETCNCKHEKIDPRLEDLAKWFDRSNNSE